MKTNGISPLHNMWDTQMVLLKAGGEINPRSTVRTPGRTHPTQKENQEEERILGRSVSPSRAPSSLVPSTIPFHLPKRGLRAAVLSSDAPQFLVIDHKTSH